MNAGKLSVCILAAGVFLFGTFLQGTKAEPGWKLVWMDDFEGSRLDSSGWSKIRRARPPAFKYMSND